VQDAEEDRKSCNQQMTMLCVGVQRMVERGTEGLLAVQRQVAAVQATADQALTQTSSDLRQRLEEVHQKQHRHQDLLQVNPCRLSCWKRKRKENTAPFGANLMRSQVLYRVAQACPAASQSATFCDTP